MVKRLILFSSPEETVLQKIIPLIFPDDMHKKVFAFMPCEGLRSGARYVAMIPEWKQLAENHQAEFMLIDNAAENAAAEKVRLQRANILFITGGNTCILLNNLRRSGLDQSIIEITQQEEFVLVGYSAGAMIQTPSIEYEIVAFDPDANKSAQLPDFAGLHLVEYEIAPHYIDEDKEMLAAYRQTRSHEVKALTDSDYIVIER